MNVIKFLNRIARDFTRPELAEEARRLADELGSLAVGAKPQPVASPQAIPFAEDYKGPRVNYHGLLARCAQSGVLPAQPVRGPGRAGVGRRLLRVRSSPRDGAAGPNR